MTRTLLAPALIIATASACTNPRVSSDTSAPKPTAGSTSEVVLRSQVEWEQLNPARGDQSPQAGTLWGDRTGPGPAGFLLKPVDGFRSPPHIHGIAYRGVVISGLIHNDDPGAEDMWMPTGSFWTQPAGGVHITAAKGDDALAYIEVEDGFGVQPAEDAFANDEKPVNVDVSNLVWLDPSGMPAPPDGPKIAYLWGSPQDDRLNGILIKLPTGFAGTIQTHGPTFRAVVIAGELKHRTPDKSKVQTMDPGSYFSSEGKTAHQVSCGAGEACIIYVRTRGKFDIDPADPSS